VVQQVLQLGLGLHCENVLACSMQSLPVRMGIANDRKHYLEHANYFEGNTRNVVAPGCAELNGACLPWNDSKKRESEMGICISVVGGNLDEHFKTKQYVFWSS